MTRNELDELCDRLMDLRKDRMSFFNGIDDEVFRQDAKACKMAVDELRRMDKQIASLRRELKNVGCENCAHQPCGNTEEPCKSCRICELKWEWEGVEMNIDSDTWKRRAEAAERDLQGVCWSCAHAFDYEVLPGCTAYQCNYDNGADRVTKRYCKNWQWRGPCAENGGKQP